MGNQKEIDQFDRMLREQMQDFQPAPPPGVISQVISGAGATATTSATGFSILSKWMIGLGIVAITSGSIYFITQPQAEITTAPTPASSQEPTSRPESIVRDPHQAETTLPISPLSEQGSEFTPASPQPTAKNESPSGTHLTEPSHSPGSNNTITTHTETGIEKNISANGKPEHSHASKPVQRIPPPVAPEFGYQWIDENRIVLSLKKNGTGQLQMQINGQTSEMTPEDGSIIALEKEGFPTQILFSALRGNQKDSFMMKIQYPLEDGLKIPNAFTPDGDGINDVYSIAAPIYMEHSFKVFDQNHRLIFEGHEWNGEDAGKPAEPGTYFVMVQYKTPSSSWLSKQFNIQLIRK